MRLRAISANENIAFGDEVILERMAPSWAAILCNRDEGANSAKMRQQACFYVSILRFSTNLYCYNVEHCRIVNRADVSSVKRSSGYVWNCVMSTDGSRLGAENPLCTRQIRGNRLSGKTPSCN